MKCNSILFSSHALIRMFDREVSRYVVIAAIHDGKTIADYPDDQPCPSRLILGMLNNNPVHVVVARDQKGYSCYVVTAIFRQEIVGVRILRRGNNCELCDL